MGGSANRARAGPGGSPGSALLALVLCWTVLLGELPSTLAFAACAAGLIATRPSPGRRPLALVSAALAGVAGWLGLPAWLLLVMTLGCALPLGPIVVASAASWPLERWAETVVLGPLFEELLYRERVLPALEARLGAKSAVLAGAGLFALPHLEPWPIWTAFLTGLGLGWLFLTTRRIELCIGLHAGLNGAAGWAATRADAGALPLLPAALLAGVVIAAARALLPGRARSRGFTWLR